MTNYDMACDVPIIYGQSFVNQGLARPCCIPCLLYLEPQVCKVFASPWNSMSGMRWVSSTALVGSTTKLGAVDPSDGQPDH
jgi:hypothetical protein